MQHFPMQLHRSEYKYSTYFVFVPAGLSVHDVMDTKYWQHVKFILKRYDVIECRAEDCAWRAEILVLSTGAEKGSSEILRAAGLKLRLESYRLGGAQFPERKPAPAVPQEPEARGPEDDLTVGFAPAHKWRVIDQRTAEVVSKGHGSREEAEQVRDAILAERGLKAA